MTTDSYVEKIKLWDENKKKMFIDNYDKEQLKKLYENINSLKNRDVLRQTDIDIIVENLNLFITSNAERSFGKVINATHFDANRKSPPSWFGPQCIKARKIFHKARAQYRYQKTHINKETLNTASKQYKTTIIRFIKNLKRIISSTFKV